MTRPRSVAGLPVAVALLAGVLIGTAASASVAAAPCPSDEGVTVVVDATALGGGIDVGCAAGSPEDGFAALIGAGFSVDTVAVTPGMVCRIDGLPAPTDETCADDPPADFYWGYWVVESGEWRYATRGAADRVPADGSVEGWAFASGAAPAAPPGVSPVALGAATVTAGTSAPLPPDAQTSYPWATAVALGVLAACGITGYRLVRHRAGRTGPAP